jgi:subtilisin family serine protease
MDAGGGFPTTATTYKWRDHGTHVAGIILGGFQSNRLTELVRDRIELRIINVVSRDVQPVGPAGQPRESFSIPLTNLQEAIAYARSDPPIPILNLSIKTDEHLSSMLEILKAGGEYLVVVAAGNDTRDIDAERPVYPAGFRRELPDSRMLTVAAHDVAGALAPFSNKGADSIDVAAPGCRVTSLLPGHRAGTMSGTSQAAPFVTFTAALLYSEGLSLREISNRIRATVRLLPGLDSLATRGNLDVEAALSIYDDRVHVRGASAPLVGEFIDLPCIQIETVCQSTSRLARLIPAARAGEPATALLISDRGLRLSTRRAPMPAGSFTFRSLGASEPVQIKWADVTDVIPARRR